MVDRRSRGDRPAVDQRHDPGCRGQRERKGQEARSPPGASAQACSCAGPEAGPGPSTQASPSAHSSSSTGPCSRSSARPGTCSCGCAEAHAPRAVRSGTNRPTRRARRPRRSSPWRCQPSRPPIVRSSWRTGFPHCATSWRRPSRGSRARGTPYRSGSSHPRGTPWRSGCSRPRGTSWCSGCSRPATPHAWSSGQTRPAPVACRAWAHGTSRTSPRGRCACRTARGPRPARSQASGQACP